MGQAGPEAVCDIHRMSYSLQTMRPAGYESVIPCNSEQKRLNQNSVFLGKGIEHLFRLMLDRVIPFRSLAEKMRKISHQL